MRRGHADGRCVRLIRLARRFGLRRTPRQGQFRTIRPISISASDLSGRRSGLLLPFPGAEFVLTARQLVQNVEDTVHVALRSQERRMR